MVLHRFSEPRVDPAIAEELLPSRGRSRDLKWMLLLSLAVALFFWKILFTKQFSFLEDWEAANQAYSWHQFAVSSIQKGILPVWDPYTFSGHTFVGEMQPGLFYPLKLLLYLWPLGESGILSARLFNQFYVLGHLLAACFMFFLAREVGLRSSFAAFVSALCFAFGGLVGTTTWPHLLDSSAWLPLIFLFFLRALRSPDRARGSLNACWSGLCFGMAILAGSLHLPMMDALVVVSAAAFFACQPFGEGTTPLPKRSRLLWIAALVLIVGVVAFASGALQLLPSLEYAPQSVRPAGDWAGPSLKKIPYAILTEGQFLPPRSLFSFLMATASIGDAEYRPYLGVLPLLLILCGVWRNWHRPWVKYLAGLAVTVFFFTLGPYSFLYGLAYLFIPTLDMAREAGRFIYLTNFAMALLAGFGVEALFAPGADPAPFFSKFARGLGIVVLTLVLILGIPTLYGKPEVNEWHFVSLIFLISGWGLFLYIIRGNRGWMAQFLLVALIVSDLHVFDWTQFNTSSEEKAGRGFFGKLLAASGVADFLKSQPGLFRVHMDAEYPVLVNLGDMFGVQTTWGATGTELIEYHPFVGYPKGLDLLNVRYIVRSGKKGPGKLVFNDGQWQVYENSTYCPRAWVVHRVVVAPWTEKIRDQVLDEAFEPRQVAFVNGPLDTTLEEDSGGQETVQFNRYQADRLELTANVQRKGLLVLSEMYYPGWEATVNGKSAPIHKVNGLLRGIVVSPGENRVVLQYRPRSVLIGAVLTALAFVGTFIFYLALRRKRRD